MISGDQFNNYDVRTYRTTRVQCSITRIWRACIYNYTHKTCTLCVITRNYASTTARMQFFYRMRLTTSTGHGSACNSHELHVLGMRGVAAVHASSTVSGRGRGACQLVKTTTKSEKLNTHRLYSSINENIEVDFTTRKWTKTSYHTKIIFFPIMQAWRSNCTLSNYTNF